MKEEISLLQNKDALSVSKFIQLVKLDIETVFPNITVVGELSRFNVTVSGHSYFTLKDENASISCVMFSSRYRRLTFKMKEGVRYIVFCKPTIYDKRGEFQINVYDMIEEGEGSIALEFERLKKKLLEKGYFDKERKKAIPDFPKTVGVITSPQAAALHDILSVSKKRAPNINIIIYPSLVQGKDAPVSIVNAVKLANKRHEVDVLILARGGGSSEDLSCFNDEHVANAIYKSLIPIVSAVGHETDTTIADLTADKRAETPTAAVEIVFPDIEGFRKYIRQTENKLISIMENRVERLGDKLKMYSAKYFTSLIEHKYENMLRRHDSLSVALYKSIEDIYEKNKTNFYRNIEKLNLLSPLKILERGYSHATKNGATLTDIKDVNVGEDIYVRLFKGNIKASVKDKEY